MLLAMLMVCSAALGADAAPAGVLVATPGKLALDGAPGVQYRFYGEVGARVKANLDGWTLRAPGANPGLLEMFQRRDRAWPYKDIVPWAGEFAGKYLIAAVQSRRMVEDPRVDALLEDFVKTIVASQGEDGYLGPFRKAEHWTGYWDLWGHYHLMQGLLMWFDATGDLAAFDAVVKAANGICKLYGEGGKRPIEAGSPETNFALLHGMGELYRRTGDARYKDLMLRIVEDMPKAGDWFEGGAKGTPYSKLERNGNRWESLHTIQGLVELYSITGDEKYKTAVLNLWTDLRDHDRHPSGAFSTNETAHGSVYDKGAIETCCSIAWLALTVDVLRLTGDPKVADELEWTTYNQVLAAQHPSGNWCTYDTPLNGTRAPSYHQINFQYRVGTPELNCCSVNGPRGLGMLRDWAIMQDEEGICLNYYGASACAVKRPEGNVITIAQETTYPAGDALRLTIKNGGDAENFTLRLRIPGWSAHTEVKVDGEPMSLRPSAGSYLKLRRDWKDTTRIDIHFDMHPRTWQGQPAEYTGRGAFFYGPLLLAFDPYFNEIETAAIPPIDAQQFKPVALAPKVNRAPGYYPPIGLWEVKAVDGKALTLCDFASAGSHGTDYAAWIPATNFAPAAPALPRPADTRGAESQGGAVLSANLPLNPGDGSAKN